MTDEDVILNENVAPFVPEDRESGETPINPGHVLDINSSGQAIKHANESSLGTAAVGNGLICDLPYDMDLGKEDDATGGSSGETVRCQYVPIGGNIDAFLAAGGDLSDSTDANITEGDILEEADLGALKAHDGTDTTGDGTGSATETVHDQGALYRAEESVDNSGASAGVGNQVRIEVTRIA